MSLDIPQLHKKSFERIRHDLINWIPNFSKEWSSRNPSDPGITILELFSWLGEATYYQIDKLPLEIYMNFLRLVTGVYEKSNIPSKISELKDNDPNLASLLQYQQTIEDKFLAGELKRDDLPDIKQRVESYMETRYRAVTRHDYETLCVEATMNDKIAQGVGDRVVRAFIQVELDEANRRLPKILLLPDAPIDYSRFYLLSGDTIELEYQGEIPVPEAVIDGDHVYNTDYILSTINTIADNAALVDKVYTYLKPRRLVGTPLNIETVSVTNIEIKAVVVFSSLLETKTSTWEALHELTRYLHPYVGGKEGSGWEFERSVTSLELSRLVERVAGVDHVRSFKLYDISNNIPVEFLDITGLPLLKKVTITAKGVDYV